MHIVLFAVSPYQPSACCQGLFYFSYCTVVVLQSDDAGCAGHCPDQERRGAAKLLSRRGGPDGAGHQGHCRLVSPGCIAQSAGSVQSQAAVLAAQQVCIAWLHCHLSTTRLAHESAGQQLRRQCAYLETIGGMPAFLSWLLHASQGHLIKASTQSLYIATALA